MFKFLKEKIKDAVSNIAKKAEASEQAPEQSSKEKIEEQPQETTEEPQEQQEETAKQQETKEPEEQEKQGFFSRIFHRKKEDEAKEEPEEQEEKEELALELNIEEDTEAKEEQEKKQEPQEIEEKQVEGQPQKTTEEPREQQEETVKQQETKEKPGEAQEGKGLLSKIKQKILTTKISEEKFEELFENLEIALLESNVAMEVIDKIKSDLKETLVEKPVKRGDLSALILESLKQSISDVLSFQPLDLEKRIKAKKPFIISFVGINGSGKTTTIAKVANSLQKKGLTCVLAAADTFRAAAIEQLEEHAQKLNLKIIKHNYGSDSAAVAFDAIKHAEAKNIDVVLIDTAGRLHSNKGLIDELKKLQRVAKPDLTIFVGESITGNDCVEQAKQFNDEIGIDAIILTKADVDEKGGAALSVSYITKKPILYLGTGQTYDSLEWFNKEKILKNLGF